MSLELHCNSRGHLRPDPEFDEIRVIFYALFNDISPKSGQREHLGIIVVDAESARDNKDTNQPSTSSAQKVHKRALIERSGIASLDTTYVSEEKELFDSFLQVVKR